jgi:uncharacterized membrane protein
MQDADGGVCPCWQIASQTHLLPNVVEETTRSVNARRTAMWETLRHNLVRRMSLMFVILLLVVLGSTNAAPEQVEAQGRGATVNVPASILYIDCPGLAPATERVRFAYVQLNGDVVVREATVENGGLVMIEGVPAVVFEQLSINWWDYDSAYRFFLVDGDYGDILVSAGNWYRDSQSGIIYQVFGC